MLQNRLQARTVHMALTYIEPFPVAVLEQGKMKPDLDKYEN